MGNATRHTVLAAALLLLTLPSIGCELGALTVPEGTRVLVRLDHAFSSEDSRSGDPFMATLDRPIRHEEAVLAPRGSQVRGRLSEVKSSGREKGRSRMTLRLETIKIGARSYSLESHPLHFDARRTVKEGAETGIGALLGAVVGAEADGGHGAANRAAVEAGAGTAHTLAIKGETIKFRPGMLLAFTLQEDAKLPPARQRP